MESAERMVGSIVGQGTSQLMALSARAMGTPGGPDEVGSPAHIVCWSLAVEEAAMHGRAAPLFRESLSVLVKSSSSCSMLWTQAASSQRRDIRAALRVLTRPPAQSVCA